MHSIVLLTALTATTGLFGGRHHKQAYCSGAPGSVCQAAQAAPQTAAPVTMYSRGYNQIVQAPAVAQAPTPYVAQATAPRSRVRYYSAGTSSCANGSCSRR